MTELFKIEIVLQGQHLLEFGDFVNAVCVEFPGCVEGQTEALIEACSASRPDIPAILLALSTLASYARNAVAVGDAVAQTIGRASPVRLEGGDSPMKLTDKTMKEEFTQLNSNFSITMSEHEGECLENALSETAYAMGHAAYIFGLLKTIIPHGSPVHPGIHSLLHICFMGFETMAHREAEWLHKAENTLNKARTAAESARLAKEASQ